MRLRRLDSFYFFVLFVMSDAMMEYELALKRAERAISDKLSEAYQLERENNMLRKKMDSMFSEMKSMKNVMKQMQVYIKELRKEVGVNGFGELDIETGNKVVIIKGDRCHIIDNPTTEEVIRICGKYGLPLDGIHHGIRPDIRLY